MKTLQSVKKHQNYMTVVDRKKQQKHILYTVYSDIIKKNVNHSRYTVWKDLKTIIYKHY